MDTASSLPILWIEKLVGKIVAWKQSGSLRDRQGVVDALTSTVKKMKYSYLEPEEIERVYVGEIEKYLKILLSLPLTEKQRTYIAYVLEEVRDLPRKLRLNPTEPFQVFRYRFVTVLSVRKHPSLGLRVTRVRDKYGKEYTVVTNLNVRTGQNALIVMLPPRDFDGVLSEAMFVAVGVQKPEDVDVNDLKRLDAYFSI